MQASSLAFKKAEAGVGLSENCLKPQSGTEKEDRAQGGLTQPSSSQMRADEKAYPEAGWGGWTAGPLWEPRGWRGEAHNCSSSGWENWRCWAAQVPWAWL